MKRIVMLVFLSLPAQVFAASSYDLSTENMISHFENIKMRFSREQDLLTFKQHVELAKINALFFGLEKPNTDAAVVFFHGAIMDILYIAKSAAPKETYIDFFLNHYKRESNTEEAISLQLFSDRLNELIVKWDNPSLTVFFVNQWIQENKREHAEKIAEYLDLYYAEKKDVIVTSFLEFCRDKIKSTDNQADSLPRFNDIPADDWVDLGDFVEENKKQSAILTSFGVIDTVKGLEMGLF